MREVWKPIKGWGHYQVSNLGNIRNGYENNLKPSPGTGNGAPFVTLYKNGISKTFILGRTVGQAFVPNPDNLRYVRHKDGDVNNNRVDNLYWEN